MSEIYKPAKATYWFITLNGVLNTGITEPHQVTTAKDPLTINEDENDFLKSVKDVVDKLPIIPAPGEWVLEGILYTYQGVVVKARKHHIRQAVDPTTLPELFVIYQEDGKFPLWVSEEKVLIGMVRNYQTVDYVCLVAHVTQNKWEPPNAPALWEIPKIVE